MRNQQQGGPISSHAKLSDAHLSAWRGLLRAHAAAVRSINQWLATHDALPLESYDVLLELFNAPEQRLRLRDLGAKVVLTRSGISRLVSRLERDALVTRVSVTGDARGVSAQLTPDGEAAFRATWPLYKEGIARHFAAYITPAEARRMAAALERVSRQDED